MNLLGFLPKCRGALLLAAAFWMHELHSAVLRVDSAAATGGNGQTWATAFSKIQEAINSASANDEIWVAAGTYSENIVLRDGLALFGGFSGSEINRGQRNWNVHATILDGGGANRVVDVPPVSSPTRLDGFVIQNGRADFGAGIYSADGEFISANNLIVHNTADGVFGGGAFVDGTACFPGQTPISFFTNVANRILQLHESDLGVDRIQIFPTNRYTPEVHRSLQLAANIYDATTNRGASYPYFPSVFRPVFTNDNGSIFISGFVEAVDDAFLTNQWLALDSAQDRALLADSQISSNANIFGQPVIVGAKKGFPNFNEFSIETTAQVTRLLELRKLTTNSFPYQTNQMYRLQITNTFGIESWNSYVEPFPRPLELRVSHTFTTSITDENGDIIWPTNGTAFTTHFVPSAIVISNWPGALSGSNSFALPYFTNIATLPLSQYLNSAPHFQPASTNFEIDSGFAIPQWTLHLSNRVQYAAVDSGHVVDFVSLDGPTAQIDLNEEMLLRQFFPEPSSISQMWNPNRIDNSTDANVPTLGIDRQILVSLGLSNLSDEDWSAFNSLQILNRDRSIAIFSKFMGFTPVIPGYENFPMPTNLTIVAPFAPIRTLFHRVSLQANDPLVHFQLSDLTHGYPATVLQPVIPPKTPWSMPSNLKQVNDFCRPYPQHGINHYFPFDPESGNPAFQDKEIGWSSDWNFPTGSCFNLQRLDKIHRGTPWQTLYTGAGNVSDFADWAEWSGSAETNPTNDWKILKMFLAERGDLGTSALPTSPVFVNNTFAANSGNGGAASFAGNATLLNNIVANNSSGLLRLPVTNDVVLQTNCVFNNAQFDYANLNDHSDDLAANPQFVSTANGNFRLLATSPCVDSGSESAFAAGLVLDEPVRRQGAGIDLGAFELSAVDAPVFVSPSISTGSSQFTFQVTGLSGESYVIETSTDLQQWFPIVTNTTVDGFFIINDSFNGDSNRFYRAVHSP